jgi:signal transduction histidine kinase
LATTRKIIEAHGGRIELHSAAGRGTKVTIRLPAVSPVSADGHGEDQAVAAGAGRAPQPADNP